MKAILNDRRSFLGRLALGLLLALTGCDTTGSFVSPIVPHVADAPSQVTATWQPNVMYAADTVHVGAQLPGIAGRVYLFSQEVGKGHPLIGEGSVIVGLFDDPNPGITPPVELEEWKIDAETLKRLAKEDVIGWGYTLFLPSTSYKPEMKHVVMKVRYDQANKQSLYCEAKVTLDTNTTIPEVRQTVKMPNLPR